MSSKSPNDDARRTSPRKSAGRMPPHYLARKTNERKGVKGAKKLGVGLKKRRHHRTMMIAIVSQVFNQGRSQGELQLVK
jgi:hypothetical protein